MGTATNNRFWLSTSFPTVMLMRAINTLDLERLAYCIADDGIESVEDAIGDVVWRSRVIGVRDAALDVLGDTTQPQIVRQRAFGRIASRLA